MTEIIMSTDLSKLSKSDIENWLENNRSGIKSYLEDGGKNQDSEDLWQNVSTYIVALGMEEGGLLTITSAIVNNLQLEWEIQNQ